jgi:tetratricopeptide (TPR) repeat protein
MVRTRMALAIGLLSVLAALFSNTSRADDFDDALAAGKRQIEGAEREQDSGDVVEMFDRTRAAIEAFNRAINIRPTNAEAFAWRAKARALVLEFDDAIRDCDTALGLDPRLAFAFRVRGSALAGKKRIEKALRDLDEAVRLDPNDPANYRARAFVLRTADRSERALADYTRVIQLAPHDPRAYSERGLLLVRLGKQETAIKDFGEAIRLDPDRLDDRSRRALARLKLHQLEPAIDDLTAVLARKRDQERLALRAPRQSKLEHRERDFEDLMITREVLPVPDLFVARGSSYQALGKHDRAIRDFNEAIDLQKDPRFYFQRARSFEELGQTERAVRDYDEGIRLGASGAPPLLKRASANFHLGRLEHVLTDLDQAIRLEPANPQLLALRAWARLAAGRGDAATDARAWIGAEGWRQWDSASMALIGYLSDARAHRDSQARAILEEGLARCDPTRWPYPVLRFFHGDLTEAALLELAETQDARTQARAFLGLYRVMTEGRSSGGEHLLWVRDHGDKALWITDVVRAMLRRLEGQTNGSER